VIQAINERDVSAMEWRVCPRFSMYEVSECGDLRRANRGRSTSNGTRIRGSIDTDGYLRYAIIDDEGKRAPVTAYRLVAEAFVGPQPSPRHEVAHNNGSRTSCYFRDLRWATRQQNAGDQLAHGTVQRGENNSHHKITEADVLFIRAEYRAIKASHGARSVSELDRRFGLCRAQIIRIAKGQAWSHIPMENVA
jgi:hypothetical protein